MYCYMSMYHPPVKEMYNTKLFSPLMLGFVLLFIYMFWYFDKYHIFKTSYLKNCDTICRIKWFDFKGFSMFLGILFTIFYMLLLINLNFGRDRNFKYLWAENFMPISLVVACIYALSLSNYSLFHRISYIGSLWCFLTVFLGPVILLTYKL